MASLVSANRLLTEKVGIRTENSIYSQALCVDSGDRELARTRENERGAFEDASHRGAVRREREGIAASQSGATRQEITALGWPVTSACALAWSGGVRAAS